MSTLSRALFILFCSGLFPLALPAQFVNFEDTWKEFLANEKTSNISKLTQPSKEEKIDYAKYCLMYATTYFCGGEIDQSEKQMSEIRSVGETAYNQIPGFKERFTDLEVKIKAFYKVDRLWKIFLLKRSVTIADLEGIEAATRVCEKGTLAKYNHMASYAYYCQKDLTKAKDYFENRVLKLAERTTLKVADVEGLEKEVGTTKKLYKGLTALGKAWKTYIDTDQSPGFKPELPLIQCHVEPSIKVHVLRAAADLCERGAAELAQIEKLENTMDEPLSTAVAKKVDWLRGEVGKYTGDEAVLNKAWEEFKSTQELAQGINFGYEYCRLEDQIKAYIMNGAINFCEQAEPMLNKIGALLQEHEPQLGADTETQLQKLFDRYQQREEELKALNSLWSSYLENGDTLLEAYELAAAYCDPIAQTKAWVIEGSFFEACMEGKKYLDQIDALKREKRLKYEEDLKCAVIRLRQKVYDCRYWELVLQARKETHAERERFGPESAKIMYGDLNSDQLPCETTVLYNPLGNIGIKYIISTYLCQEIDLAKMGDPEYYKKIASWVDSKVLQAYCETSMRCKEDFFIYLEGHTDGHAFKGARYKKSLDIPEGTIFTHYLDEEVAEKNTEREITNSLRSNMELGIARAWTVKHQLDFMEVPIEIGAYEHPDDEKGGEYRKVDIELNITNLLLDFYEKRLQELLDASGIGKRPDDC
ncbi:MAG: hypothetical protein AAFW73_02420 [Bacteroidota bacterium]